MRKRVLILHGWCLLAVLVFFPIQAMAGAYVLPISYIGRVVTQQIIAWEENDYDLNPCYGWRTCYLGPDVLYPSSWPGMWGSCVDRNHCIRIEQYKTRKQVRDAWIARKGVPYNANYPVATTNATCVGIFYAASPVHWSKPNAGTGRVFPGSVCGKIPPANQSCDVQLPAEINFGSLSANSIAGQYRDVTGRISCSLAGSVALYGKSLLNERNIYLDGNKRNLSARLLINNRDAWEGAHFYLPGSHTATSFTLRAVLQTTTLPAAGSYSGSGVVYVAYL